MHSLRVEYIKGIETMLTPEEVAALLKVQPKTVGDMARAGKLPHYKVGALLRFKISDLLPALEKMRGHTRQERAAMHQRAITKANT